MKQIKKFIIYFPVILVILQVCVNIFALIDRQTYQAVGFYLSTFIGTNILFAIFLVAFTFSFKFCTVSRSAAVAELLFGLNYLIVQDDNTYNIIFQIVVGCVSLIAAYRYFVRSFPLCKISLWHKFLGAVLITRSCHKALQEFEKEIKPIITKARYQHHGST